MGKFSLQLKLSILLILFSIIITSPSYAVLSVTVGPNSLYNYQDLQLAINGVLGEPLETEAVIRLEAGEYARSEGFHINIGGSNIQKLSLVPIDDMAEVMISIPGGGGSDSRVLRIEGNGNEDKEVSIERIKFPEGPYRSTSGIYLYRGFRKVSIRECSFTNVSYSIHIDLNISHGGIHELEILDNTFVCDNGTENSQDYAFIYYNSGAVHTQPEDSSFHISGNNFSGSTSKHIDLRLMYAIPELVIENNTLYSELYNLEGFPSAFHANIELSSIYGNAPDDSNYTKPVIRNNEFINSGIKISSISADILNNSFRETFDNFNFYHIGVFNEQYSFHDRMINIRENIFRGDIRSAISMLPYNSEFVSSVMKAQVINNTFISCNHSLLINTLPNGLNGPVIVPKYINNLLIDHSDPVHVRETLTGIQREFDPPIDAENCFFEADPNQWSNLTLNNCGYGDPVVDIGLHCDYSLIWDANIKSPLINTGCPEIDGVSQSDPDGTPPDIGARYYPHHHRKYFDRTDGSGIYWLSFPVLDDKSNTNGTYWNELGYMFESHMQDAPDSQLNQIHWSYDREQATMDYDDVNAVWMQTDHRAYQPIGYKIQFNTGMYPSPVVVNGFKADPDTTPISWVVEHFYNGQMQAFSNMIGYFLQSTHPAGLALSRYLPGSTRYRYLDYVHTIKTRYWSTYRIQEEMGSPWIIDPNTYTFSEGDMVELLLLPNAPEEMYWNTSVPSTPPVVRTRASAFDYKELLDYTSLIVEFDPDDLPDEVGVFVNGECIGASVVDSTVVDICMYLDGAKSFGEMELVFHYESKGKKKAKNWKVYNPESMVFEENPLNFGMIDRFAYISFSRKAGDSPVPLATTLYQNYPNPFNPTTNISFVLGSDMPVKLDIFNVRGQKVKTLCDLPLSKGKHSLQWNGRDGAHRPVASGIYFYRLSTPEGIRTQKMMLMK